MPIAQIKTKINRRALASLEGTANATIAELRKAGLDAEVNKFKKDIENKLIKEFRRRFKFQRPSYGLQTAMKVFVSYGKEFITFGIFDRERASKISRAKKRGVYGYDMKYEYWRVLEYSRSYGRAGAYKIEPRKKGKSLKFESSFRPQTRHKLSMAAKKRPIRGGSRTKAIKRLSEGIVYVKAVKHPLFRSSWKTPSRFIGRTYDWARKKLHKEFGPKTLKILRAALLKGRIGIGI